LVHEFHFGKHKIAPSIILTTFYLFIVSQAATDKTLEKLAG